MTRRKNNNIADGEIWTHIKNIDDHDAHVSKYDAHQHKNETIMMHIKIKTNHASQRL